MNFLLLKLDASLAAMKNLKLEASLASLKNLNVQMSAASKANLSDSYNLIARALDQGGSVMDQLTTAVQEPSKDLQESPTNDVPGDHQ